MQGERISHRRTNARPVIIFYREYLALIFLGQLQYSHIVKGKRIQIYKRSCNALLLEQRKRLPGLMDHIACSYNAEVVSFSQDMMSTKRKGRGIAVQARYIGPERPQITRPLVSCHGHGERVGRIGISRLQQVEKRFALLG